MHLLHFQQVVFNKNKNYYVVIYAGYVGSKNTWKLTPVFNESLNESSVPRTAQPPIKTIRFHLRNV